jgi:photosystem II stability/assembly factor-like uncharacterized protein
MMSPSVEMQDLCILDDGLHGWAVGAKRTGGEYFSVIFRTTNGENWEVLPTSFPDIHLTELFFITPDSGWVVGADGYILATRDGGDNWQAQSSGTERTLRSLHFVNSSVGWITGDSSHDDPCMLVLKTTDGGGNWQDLSCGDDFLPGRSIFFTDTQNGWIAGISAWLEPHIHYTGDGGLNWVRQSVPIWLGSASDIAFATPQIGWATTSGSDFEPTGAVLHTVDGGVNWEIQTYTDVDYNYSLDVRSELEVVVAAGSPTPQVFLTYDGGTTWENHASPTSHSSHGVSWIGDDIWFTTTPSQILHSRDNGVTWEWANHASTWESLAWSDTQNGWLTTGTHIQGNPCCYRTTDGGSSWWHDVDAPGGAQVQFVDVDHGWMLWDSGDVTVWRTVDGGASWAQHSISNSQLIRGIFFVDSTRGWAFGDNGAVYLTDDGGVSWSHQGSGIYTDVRTLYFINSDEGWLAGGNDSGSGGFIRHTMDGGENWLVQTPALPDNIQSIYFINDQLGWSLGYGGSIQATWNGGAEWQQISGVIHDDMAEIFMIDEQTGWIATNNSYGLSPAEDARGFIYKTIDGGFSWEQEWSSPWPRNEIYDIALQPDGDLWVCGAHSTLLFAEISENVVEPATANRFVLSQNFPNPFNPVTTIPYSLATITQINLTVFDMLGRQVTTLVNNLQAAGEYEVTFDANGLPTGIYYYRLTAGDQIQTGKMLLVR